ncbi:GDSL esterase/lipase CPRD49, partial [Mucuna pruriens]
MSGSLRPQFVVFGSSIVQFGFYEGWISILSHLYARKADIVLRGYAGWNSRRALQVLDKIFPKDAPVQPSLVIVYFGGNDSSNPHSSGLGPHVPLQEYVENMRKIVNHLKSLSENTRILLLSAPPINDATITLNSENSDGQPSRTNEACRIYSEACLKVCSEMNIKAIDLWSAIQTVDNWQDVCFIDGIHLSAEGSKIVWKEILKVLKEAEWEPSLYWKSMPSEFEEDSPYYPVASDGKTTLNLSNFAFPGNDKWD